MQTSLQFTFRSLVNPYYHDANFLSFYIIMMNPANHLSICCKSAEFFLKLVKLRDHEYGFSHSEHSFDISPHVPRNYDLYVLLQLYHTEDNFRDRTLLAYSMQLVRQDGACYDLVFYLSRCKIELSIAFSQKPADHAFRFFKISDLHISMARQEMLEGISLFDTFCVELSNHDYSVMEQVDSVFRSGRDLHIVLRRAIVIDCADYECSDSAESRQFDDYRAENACNDGMCDSKNCLVFVLKAVNFADKSYASMINFLYIKLVNLARLTDNQYAAVAVDLQLFRPSDKFLRFNRVTKYVDAHLQEIEQNQNGIDSVRANYTAWPAPEATKKDAVAALNALLSPERYLYYAQKMGVKTFISFYDDYALLINGDYGLETREFQLLEALYDHMCYNKVDLYENDTRARVFFNVTRTGELRFQALQSSILYQIQAVYQRPDAIVLNPIAQTSEQLQLIEFKFSQHDTPIEFITFYVFQSMYVINAAQLLNKVIRVFLQERIDVRRDPNENFFLVLYNNPVILEPIQPTGPIKIAVIDPIARKPVVYKEIPQSDVEKLLQDGDDFEARFVVDDAQIDIGIKPGSFKRRIERPIDPPGMTIVRQKFRPVGFPAERENLELRRNYTNAEMQTDEQVFPKAPQRTFSYDKLPTNPSLLARHPRSRKTSEHHGEPVINSNSESDDAQLDEQTVNSIRKKLINGVNPLPNTPIAPGDIQDQHSPDKDQKTQEHTPEQPNACSEACPNERFYYRRLAPVAKPEGKNADSLCNRRQISRLPDYSNVQAKIDSKPVQRLLKHVPSKIINKPQYIVAVSKIADYFYGKTNVVPGREKLYDNLHEQQQNILNALGVHKKEYSTTQSGEQPPQPNH